MTKPTPEFIEHNRLFGTHRHRWHGDLLKAATYLRCELRISRFKNWREAGGPEWLERLRSDFTSKLIAWAAEGRAKAAARRSGR
jgi:hypothetical protein